MKNIKYLDKSFSGTWHRDCELLSFKFKPSPLELIYYRDEDSTNWKINFDSVAAFRLITEELSVFDYLIFLPVDGSFYELVDSPWLAKLKETEVSCR